MREYDNPDWLRKRYVELRLNMGEIAQIFGVSRWVIRDRLIKFNIPIRPGSEAQKLKWDHKPGNHKDRTWLYSKYWIEQLSKKQIAQLCGVSEPVIGRWIRVLGIPPKTNAETRMKSRFADALITYRNQGWLQEKYEKEKLSADVIAKSCGTHGATVKYWLRKYGISIRTLRDSHLGNVPSESTREKMGAARSEYLRKHPEAIKRGIESPFYKNGRGNFPYLSTFNKTTRKQIRSRDEFCCQLCGAGAQDTSLHVHHINYDINDSRGRNLITLCLPHHTQSNYSRNKWQFVFETYQAIRHLSA